MCISIMLDGGGDLDQGAVVARPHRGADRIDAIKKRGTKAGHSFDDPASHRELDWVDEGLSPDSLWRPIQGYRSIGVPDKFGKATQRPAERATKLP